jgi:mercuric ion transport protein
MRKENLSSMGTVAASLLATSCCIGPAIFVIFGTSVGFLGKLSFLEPLTPYFIIVGFLMLGYSFWRLYLRKSDCTCKADIRARRMARSIWWVGFAALVFASSFRTIIIWIYA